MPTLDVHLFIDCWSSVPRPDRDSRVITLPEIASCVGPTRSQDPSRHRLPGAEVPLHLHLHTHEPQKARQYDTTLSPASSQFVALPERKHLQSSTTSHPQPDTARSEIRVARAQDADAAASTPATSTRPWVACCFTTSLAAEEWQANTAGYCQTCRRRIRPAGPARPSTSAATKPSAVAVATTAGSGDSITHACCRRAPTWRVRLWRPRGAEQSNPSSRSSV